MSRSSSAAAAATTAGGGGLPLVFIGGTILAYFNMQAIPDTTSRVLASVGVGLVASIGGSLGAAVGGIGGAIGGAVTGGILGSFKRAAAPVAVGGAILFGIAGALGGSVLGIYEGYEHTKNFALDKLTPKPAAVPAFVAAPAR